MTDSDKTAATALPEPGSEASPAEVSNAAARDDIKPPSSNAHVRQSRGQPVLMLVLVLIVAAAAGVGYWLWQQLQQRENQVEVLSAQIADARGQIESIQTRIQEQVGQQLTANQTRAEAREQELRQRVAEMEQDQTQLRQQVDGQQQRLASLSTTSREDWLLAEAEYLLKIANQRVLMERSTDNTVALLRSADERLQQASEGTGDAELFAIRKALSRDLAALEQVEPLDKEGLYLRLYALADNVGELPRMQLAEFGQEGDTGSPLAQDALERGWADRIWQGLRDLVGSLDRFVRIDDVEAPAKPLVDSYATRLAALNVELLLEQAQLALLQEEATIYQHSLQQAQELLKNYYVESDQNTRLQSALDELAGVDVAPELPDISASLTLLRDYLRQLHRVQPAPKGQLSQGARAEGQP